MKQTDNFQFVEETNPNLQRRENSVSIVDDAVAYVKRLFENEYSGYDYFHLLGTYKLVTLPLWIRTEIQLR